MRVWKTSLATCTGNHNIHKSRGSLYAHRGARVEEIASVAHRLCTLLLFGLGFGVLLVALEARSGLVLM